jgi:hypothetical protein
VIELAENTHTGAIRFDDVRDGPIQLTAEEAVIFEKRVKELQRLLADTTVVDKYKLEVMFGKARSITNPTPGILSFWLSGSKFHGGGDEKLYLCPGASLKKNGCVALLPDSSKGMLGVACPKCGSIWKHEDLVGELMFNLPMRKWAVVLYRYYRVCDYNCDIYLKYSTHDLRAISIAQADRQTWAGSKKLDETRDKRVRALYPLKNIIKDVSAGADLLGRFYAFLTA